MAAALAAALLSSLAAHAQLSRAYLAPMGSDANPCTAAAPCRMLPAALAAVADWGEIQILDAGTYNAGTVNVSKNVNINATGHMATFISTAGGPALTLGPYNLRLRNVEIVNDEASYGTDGIVAASGGSLGVDQSVIAVSGTGINASNAVVEVDQVNFHDCGNGIFARGGSTTNVTRSKFFRTGNYAIYADGSLAGYSVGVTVADTEITNGFLGIFANATTSTSIVRVNVTRVEINNSSYGVAVMNGVAGGSAVLSIGSSMITSNGYGLYQGGGAPAGATLESQGNNLVRNNNFGVVGTLTTVGSM
jgi:hypothetical protein